MKRKERSGAKGMNDFINTSQFGVRRAPHYRDFKDIPQEMLVLYSYKLYALCSLAWEYVETVLDLCIEIRLTPTKPLVRKIRGLKSSYDRFRASTMGKREEEIEYKRGLEIEEYLSKDFDRLFYSLFNEVSKLDLTPYSRKIVIAVQQAMTLLDAVKIFSRECDNMIHSFGVPYVEHCMVQKEVLALYPLIPQFAGDQYKPNLSARKITAGIIAKSLLEYNPTFEPEEINK